MSERLADLARRKQLLLARSRLHRLELQHHTRSLRRSIATPRGAFAIASSAPLRPLLFSALTMALGRGRLSRLLRGAMAVLAAAKTVSAVASALAQKRAQASAAADHEEWLIDEAEAESFPASDPSSIAQPHRRPR